MNKYMLLFYYIPGIILGIGAEYGINQKKSNKSFHRSNAYTVLSTLLTLTHLNLKTSL